MDGLLLIDDFLVRLEEDGTWSCRPIDETEYSVAHSFAVGECNELLSFLRRKYNEEDYQYQLGDIATGYNPITHQPVEFTVFAHMLCVDFDLGRKIPKIVVERKYLSCEDRTLYSALEVESLDYNDWSGWVKAYDYSELEYYHYIDLTMPLVYNIQDDEPVFCIREDVKTPNDLNDFLNKDFLK